MRSILLFIIMLFGVVLPTNTRAQTITSFDFDTINWDLPENYQIVEFEGENALMLERTGDIFKSGSGAYLKGYEFSDGIIEFDLYCPERANTFVGFMFRLTNYNEEDRYELFIFRPFMVNTLGTVQYLPVNNGAIHSTTYVDDVFQGIGDVVPNIWNHVKAEIEGPRAVVYVNDEEVITVNNLGRGLSGGSIGVWLGDTTPRCYFANFSVTN